MKQILTIMKKELKRFFCDRRMVMTTVLLPGLMIYLIYSLMGNALTDSFGVDEGYIEGLFVHKDYRGLGVGTKLIAYVLQYYDFIELDVFEKNYGAVCFYENRNFQKLRSLPHEDLGEIEYRMCYRKKKEE